MTAGHAAPAGEAGTRARILRAAAALFHARGFEGTSMNQIAAAVGIQKSSLYHHFRSKDELLFDILRHTVDVAIGGLQAIVAADLSAAQRLRLAVRHHVINLVEDLDNVACFIEESKALGPRHREAYIVRRDAYERCFREIIEEGIARGEFRPADVRLAGFAVLGMCNWIVRWYHPDGPNTPEEVARQFGDLAVAALAAGREAAVPLGAAGSMEGHR